MAFRKLFLSYNRTLQMGPKLRQIRWSSYKSSLYLEDINSPNRQYEVTKDPVDWENVSRLLPPTFIPQPLEKASYPSGWKPQAKDLSDRPYFVPRTRNHMIPCYLIISQNRIKKTTILRHIRGDIWLLQRDIKAFLGPQSFMPIRSQVNEYVGHIRINGDHVNAIKYFLEEKGF